MSTHFPSFSEGLSLRRRVRTVTHWALLQFPFLFGGTFIEAARLGRASGVHLVFPFLFGGTFIEARSEGYAVGSVIRAFPFLFGGTFIEAY